MALAEDVNRAITDAMKAKDPARLGPLRMLKAALMNREIERGRALDDTESRQVVSALVKQRRDSIEQFLKGGRQDLADKETAEIAVLEAYLPPAVDAADLERAVDAAIASTGATSAKDMGTVMKAVMAELAGKTVDGKAVNELVRRKLDRERACSPPGPPPAPHIAARPIGRRHRHRDDGQPVLGLVRDRCSRISSAPATRWTPSASRSASPTCCAISSPKAP